MTLYVVLTRQCSVKKVCLSNESTTHNPTVIKLLQVQELTPIPIRAWTAAMRLTDEH